MRGIAAIGVCYFHAAEHFVNTASIKSGIEYNIMHLFCKDIDLGKIAVVIFFAISGFVVPFSIFKYNKNHLYNFAINRFFRLYPVY